MSIYTFTYTLHHILLLKLAATFSFNRVRTLHNFLFLAAANSPPAQRLGIRYQFYKGTTGVHSFEIEAFLNDLTKGDLIKKEGLSLTKEGHDFYYQVASLLRYESFPQYCIKMALNYQNNLWRVNHEIVFHPLFRKYKTGRKIVIA